MSTVLVDSNVLLDVLLPDPEWEAVSSEALARAADDAYLAINPVVFAEVSVGFREIEALEDALPAEIRREGIPWDAAFLAGKAFVRYRRAGGTRTSTLPDFFIGAHAAVRGYALLTRDPGRYRRYFPTVELLQP